MRSSALAEMESYWDTIEGDSGALFKIDHTETTKMIRRLKKKEKDDNVQLLAKLAKEERLSRVEMMKQVAERAERENVSLESLLPTPKFSGLAFKPASKLGKLANSVSFSSMTMGDDSWD